ncbi:hypothetical protein [Nitrospina watsonii]|uniref:Translation elongation factor 1 gamma subunit n=1 Tax=Nitrospina watsonii TaxID=1323948 RepID=A0ABN8W3L7_9BACT|nr:hypothetical protein [Nitrospina watsonii]CAI2718765.1 Translation elongation factor 1 gamma subunit [Nitrospina watsonii]
MAKRKKAKSKKKNPDVPRQGKDKDAAEPKSKRPQSASPRAKEKADELARIWDEDLCE